MKHRILAIVATAALFAGSAQAQPADALRIQQNNADGTAIKTVVVPYAPNGVLATGTGGAIAIKPQSELLTLPPRLSGTSETITVVSSATESGFYKRTGTDARLALSTSGTQVVHLIYNNITGRWESDVYTSGTASGVTQFVMEAPQNSKSYNRTDGTWTEAVPLPTGTGDQIMKSGTWADIFPLIIPNQLWTGMSGSRFYINQGGAISTNNAQLILDPLAVAIKQSASPGTGYNPAGVSVSTGGVVIYGGTSVGTPTQIKIATTEVGTILNNLTIAPGTSGSHAVTKSQLDTKQDLLTAGSGITIVGGTISATGTGGGGSYTLPIATSSTLGGVMIGSGIDITGGTISTTWPSGSTALQSQITTTATSLAAWTGTVTYWGGVTSTLSGSLMNVSATVTYIGGSLATVSGSLANKLDTSVWTSGSTALQTSITNAITTSTNFAKSYYVSGSGVTITGGTISATGGGGGGGFPINGDAVSITNPAPQEIVITGSTGTPSAKVTIRAELGSDPIEYIGPGVITLDAGKIERKVDGSNPANLEVPAITAIGGTTSYQITRNIVFTTSMTGTVFELPMQNDYLGTHVFLFSNHSGKTITVTWDGGMQTENVSTGAAKLIRVDAEGNVTTP